MCFYCITICIAFCIAKENAESIYKKQYNLIEGDKMAFKFVKDKKKETVNKTIRFPQDLVDRIEKEVIGADSYFSSFVIQACEYALKESELKYNSKEKKKTTK